MTSRERLLTAIRRGRPDRVPIGPFTFGALRWGNPVLDEMIRVADPFVQCGCGGNPIWGADVPIERREDGDVTISILHTPKGDLRSVRRRTSITSATVEFYCKTPDDAEKWFSLPFRPADPDPADFRLWHERTGDAGLVIAGLGDAICLPAELFSPEDFSLLWIDAPDVMRRLVATAAGRINAFVDAASRMGIDAWRIVGGEYASVQLGPAAFQELVVEPDRELCDIMRRHGAVSYFHNHGPVTRFYDQFVAIGIDALDPLEAPPWGDCDLVEAKRRLAGHVCIVGNLDDMEILDKLPWEEIEPIATERLLAAGPDGFVLGGTASGTYTEHGARMFMKLVPVAEALANRWV